MRDGALSCVPDDPLTVDLLRVRRAAQRLLGQVQPAGMRPGMDHTEPGMALHSTSLNCSLMPPVL